MGTTTQHPLRLPLPQRIIRYPPNANRPRFKMTVRATLSTMLTTIQNRQPGPTRRKEDRPSLAWHHSYPFNGRFKRSKAPVQTAPYLRRRPIVCRAAPGTREPCCPRSPTLRPWIGACKGVRALVSRTGPSIPRPTSDVLPDQATQDLKTFYLRPPGAAAPEKPCHGLQLFCA